MKRTRNSECSKTQMGNSDEQIQMSGLSISDLPTVLFIKILLKLPVKSIALCKCVCKTWHSLISEPHFAEAHLGQSKTCTLIRDREFSSFSRSFYLLDPKDVCFNDSEYRPLDTTLRTKLKIPLRNVQAMLDVADNIDDPVFCVGTRTRSETKHFIKLGSSAEHRYNVVNSCNGLLCLCYSDFYPWDRNCTVEIVVCNPVLGEFVHIPNNFGGDVNDEDFGLGFSPKHNRYEVIRMSHQIRINPVTGIEGWHVVTAEIHTLGSDSWRSVDISAVELSFLHNPVYLEGSLYWITIDDSGNYQVASFDLDEERFHVHSALSPPPYRGDFHLLGIAVLEGHVYVYSTTKSFTDVGIWLMNESKTWTKLFTIDVSELSGSGKHCMYQVICCLNNEAVVIFGGSRNQFMYYDKSEGLRFKHLKFEDLESNFEAIPHTPSFISLKDIVKQGNVEVLNVNSGCGKLKLEEETYPLLLQGGRNQT